jgi:hypothetical protein
MIHRGMLALLGESHVSVCEFVSSGNWRLCKKMQSLKLYTSWQHDVIEKYTTFKFGLQCNQVVPNSLELVKG